MKDSTPDFAPLRLKHKEILEKIESLKAECEGLTFPEDKARTGQIHQEINALTVKAVRFLVKNVPGADRSKGLFRLCIKKYLAGYQTWEITLADCLRLHPMAPKWFPQHLWEWREMQRLQAHGREPLRETGIVGLEAGIRKPIDMTLAIRVLELRGAENEGDGAEEISPAVEDAMLQNAKPQFQALPERKKRIRKERRTWEWVIKQLVQEGLLPKEITRQALKDRLKNIFTDYPWEEV